jgi:Na+/melibiose symporter-like transporter
LSIYRTGNIAVNLSSTVVNFFVNSFFLEVALVPPAYAGTILLIAKVPISLIPFPTPGA